MRRLVRDAGERLDRALAGLMPPDIEVSQVQGVPLEFHSRFSAIARRYSYHLLFRRYSLPEQIS